MLAKGCSKLKSNPLTKNLKTLGAFIFDGILKPVRINGRKNRSSAGTFENLS